MEKAAREGDYENLQIIIDSVSDFDDFPKKDLNKALLSAVQGATGNSVPEHIDCVNILLSCDANINAEDPSTGKTALMIACEKGYILLVEALLERDAQVNHRDNSQKTPLFYAIDTQAENIDVILILIEKGADVNATSIEGWSALLLAVHKKHH
jgi:ankyrin repeat protein